MNRCMIIYTLCDFRIANKGATDHIFSTNRVACRCFVLFSLFETLCNLFGKVNACSKLRMWKIEAKHTKCRCPTWCYIQMMFWEHARAFITRNCTKMLISHFCASIFGYLFTRIQASSIYTFMPEFEFAFCVFSFVRHRCLFHWPRRMPHTDASVLGFLVRYLYFSICHKSFAPFHTTMGRPAFRATNYDRK